MTNFSMRPLTICARKPSLFSVLWFLLPPRPHTQVTWSPELPARLSSSTSTKFTKGQLGYIKPYGCVVTSSSLLQQCEPSSSLAIPSHLLPNARVRMDLLYSKCPLPCFGVMGSEQKSGPKYVDPGMSH